MNKKNIPITERKNEVRQFLYDCYVSKLMTAYGFEVDMTFENRGTQIRWAHPEHGWSLIIYSDYASMRIEDGGWTKIPGNARFTQQLVTDGVFDWADGFLNADYESPLEEIFRVLLHYLPDEDIIRCLRDATNLHAWTGDEDVADEPDDAAPSA